MKTFFRQVLLNKRPVVIFILTLCLLLKCTNTVGNVPDGVLRYINPHPLAGEQQVAKATSYALSSDRKWIAMGYQDGSIRIFHANTGEQVFQPGSPHDGFPLMPVNLKQDTEPVVFLAFMKNDYVLVASHQHQNYSSGTVSYYFDIRSFFDPRLVKLRVVVERVDGVSPEDLVMEDVIINHDLKRVDNSTIWPEPPVPLPSSSQRWGDGANLLGVEVRRVKSWFVSADTEQDTYYPNQPLKFFGNKLIYADEPRLLSPDAESVPGLSCLRIIELLRNSESLRN